MKKEVVFVIGLPFYGKSHYIKEHFADYYVIDLYDYQKNLPVDVFYTLSSYFKCAQELCLALRKYDKIVLEHTLVKAKRRKLYIDIVSELVHIKPKVVLLKPSFDTYNKNRKARGENIVSKKEYLFYLEQMEIPDVSEGFSEVETVEY